MTDYTALGLVDFSVLSHWGEFPFEEVSKQTAETYGGQLNLLKLTNNQAVLVKNGQYRVETAD